MTAIYVKDTREERERGRWRRWLVKTMNIDNVMNAITTHALGALDTVVHHWSLGITVLLEPNLCIAKRMEHRDIYKHV